MIPDTNKIRELTLPSAYSHHHTQEAASEQHGEFVFIEILFAIDEVEKGEQESSS
jgi:hypothetical protein